MKKHLTAILLTVACCAAAAAGQAHRTRSGRLPYPAQKKLTSDPGWQPVMAYHGGPILAGPTNLYVVYYGSFTAKQHSILDTFLQHVGGSKTFNVAAEYYDLQGQYVGNNLPYDPTTNSYDDAYSMGTTLSGNYFETALLHNAVAGGHLPSDANGLYILTISPDVKLPDNVWCAYHAYTPEIVAGTEVTYAIAPDPPSPILGGCSGNIAIYHDTVSPNFDMGMDSVVDSLLHELGESTTDPDITAWYTYTGQEMGDLCNFVYGPTFITPNGSHANHKFGNRNYLAQELWSITDPVGCAQGH